MSVERQRLAAMLPHGDSMSLIDSVEHWDATHIRCHADPARDDNPLREHATLGTALLIEYAGQAAALHGALQSGPDGSAAPAYIGAVKNVELLQSGCAPTGPITLDAECAMQSGQGSIYEFSACQHNELLIRGRLIINHT